MKGIAFGSPEAPPPPSKIVAVGRNYREHAKELGHVAPEEEPILFLKAPSALLLNGGDIVLPPESARVDYEGELALVIGQTIKRWTEDRWMEALAGVCCANDVTARDLQKKDGQWSRAKSFDTFCPVGPEIVAGLDASDLAIQTRVNGAAPRAAPSSSLPPAGGRSRVGTTFARLARLGYDVEGLTPDDRQLAVAHALIESGAGYSDLYQSGAYGYRLLCLRA